MKHEKTLKDEFLFLKNLIKIITDNSQPLNKRLDESLKMLLNKIRGVHGSIMLINSEKKYFSVVASTNKKILSKKIPIDPSTISGHVYLTGKPLYYKDVTKSKKFKSKTHRKNYSTPSLMCIPLKGQKEVIGVVNVSDHIENSYFSKNDFISIKDYSSVLSPLLETSCLFYRLEIEKERYRRLAQELKMTYTERSELVEMVVHDFKSPLSAVISNLELLKYIGVNEKQKAVIDTAINGARKLLDMINEFLQIARVDEFQKSHEKFGPVSLKKVLNKTLEDLIHMANNKSISVEIGTENDVLLWGSESLFLHLFQNLILNGIKYTPEGGKVRIFWEVKRAKRKEDRFNNFCKISIEDTGPGIPDEEKKTIFDKFKRLKRDQTNNPQGSGIGLFICKKIVNLLEGKIWIEDVHPTGTRFCVTCYVWEKNHGQDKTCIGG